MKFLRKWHSLRSIRKRKPIILLRFERKYINLHISRQAYLRGLVLNIGKRKRHTSQLSSHDYELVECRSFEDGHGASGLKLHDT